MDKTYRKPVSYFDTVTSGMVDTVGYAAISNTGSLGAFTGATVPALASATYDIDITVDGTIHKLAVALLNTDSWSGICTKIQTALRTATSKLETVAVSGGKIVVTSATDGATSTILIEAGTTGSGGGDLLAAIDAIGATYVVSLDTPVDGTEGTITFQITNTVPSDDFRYIYQVKSSSGLEKTGLISSYNKSTGYLTISDNGTTSEIAAGDTITVSGVFIK